MDALGVCDINGLVCKESTYKKRKKDISALIKMQFDCEKYVLSDLNQHSATMLGYLKTNASTKYTLDEFKQALIHQYFPLTEKEIEKEILSIDGKYSIDKQTAITNQYLMEIGVAKSPRPVPKIISLDP